MSLDKSEVILALLNDLGADVDDHLEQARAELTRYQGGQGAIKQAITAVEQNLKIIEKDRDAGKLTQDQANAVRTYVDLVALGALRNLIEYAEVQKHVSTGKIQALEAQVKRLKAKFDATKIKRDLLRDGAANGAVEEGRPGARVPGGHPGNPLAERRGITAPAPAPAPAPAEEPAASDDEGAGAPEVTVDPIIEELPAEAAAPEVAPEVPPAEAPEPPPASPSAGRFGLPFRHKRR